MAEDVLKKKGPELFRELLRLYPHAEAEDYIKAGAWREDMMKVDIQLVEANRSEAGAEDPPPLEEVKLPADMPKGIISGAVAPPLGLVKVPGALINAAAAAGAIRPVLGGIAGLAPAAVPGAAAGPGPVAELRLIALFVAKWKLDPARTKMLLAKLTPYRRRHIIQSFKALTPGGEATDLLEKYIEECEKTDSWGSAAPALIQPSPAAAAMGLLQAGQAAAALVTMKRPLTPSNPLLDPSKRPRMVTAVLPKAVVAAPRPGWAAMAAHPMGAAMGGPRALTTARPVAGMGVNPMMRPQSAQAQGASALIRQLGLRSFPG